MRPSNEEIAARSHQLQVALGPAVGPVQAAQRGIELARRSGRTTEMIKALPDDGRAIIVLLEFVSWHNHVKQQVLILRGPDYPVNALKVMTLADVCDNKHRLFVGWGSYPLFVDNDVTDKMLVDFVTSLQPPATASGQ